MIEIGIAIGCMTAAVMGYSKYSEYQQEKNLASKLEEARIRKEIEAWIYNAVAKNRSKISSMELIKEFNKKYPGRKHLFDELVASYN